MGVAGRHLFYNNSSFDGNNLQANEADDAAIATDKTALLPGAAAGFANYSSFTRGINGVMIDVFNFNGSPSPGSFLFRSGFGGSPSTWGTVTPSLITIRRGAGVQGSDRITVTFQDGAIRGTWLQVTTNATLATGLGAADVFYFASLPGESGDSATPTRVSALDLASVKRLLNGASAVTGPVDFNRDGRVNALDQATVRANLSRELPGLSAPAQAVPMVAPASGVFSDAAVGATSVLRESEAESKGATGLL
jgi:hypothetical protein